MSETPRPESRAVKVTLYEDRAEVVRRAKVSLLPGLQWVAVPGVSLFVDDRSVQAKVEGEAARLVSVRVLRRVESRSAMGQETVTLLEDEERAARDRVTEAARAAGRAKVRERRSDELVGRWAKALSQVPHARTESPLADWREAYQELLRATEDALSARLSAHEAREDAAERAARAAARLAQARAAKPVSEAVIEVQVESPRAQEVELTLVYRTPCALWRPEHLARLAGDPARPAEGTIEIVTFATAWQCTGEDWSKVPVAFSTARPSREASPPLLADDVLRSRKKTSEERKTVAVEARDQAIAVAGLGGERRAVEEMPGVDDGGLPLCFATSGPVDLVSDGEPQRVEIGRVTLAAAVALVLVPERAAVAHMKATATLGKGPPLLAGPLCLARENGFVGRAKTDFVAPGEPLAIGFGPDDGLRVRRAQTERRDRTPAIGTQKIERTVRLYLSNLSDTAKGVEVTERIPVSEIEEIDVRLVEEGGFKLEGKDGFLKQELSVAPRATKVLELKYEIRAKSNVQLPF